MRGDRGETLLELVVAVLIIGVAVTAIVGAIGVSIMVSDTHRKQATAGTTVRDYAEAVQHTISTGGYSACAGTTAYKSPTGFTVPTGYTANVLSVRYWSGSAWQSACTTDTGLQQLTLQVASGDGRASEQLVIAVRKPCRPTDPLC